MARLDKRGEQLRDVALVRLQVLLQEGFAGRGLSDRVTGCGARLHERGEQLRDIALVGLQVLLQDGCAGRGER